MRRSSRLASKNQCHSLLKAKQRKATLLDGNRFSTPSVPDLSGSCGSCTDDVVSCLNNEVIASIANLGFTLSGLPADILKEKIVDCFRAHYINFLGLSHPPLLQINWYDILPPHPDIRALGTPFSASEVDQVIKCMKNHKSPGPDDIPMEFFKAFWKDLGPSVTKILNDLMLQHADLQRINSAFITLIPKKEGANTINDFRPISLENNIVKIFSKLLANILAIHMKSLIDNKQGAFTQGRSTLNCFMIVAETIGACKVLDQDSCLIKFGFAKAFDSIGWSFIEHMLAARGFSNSWISWISYLLLSSSSSILINGNLSISFAYKRDRPSNPLLFNLVADTLSRLISSTVWCGIFHGVLLNFTPNGISHILFADDLIMFCKASSQCFSKIRLFFKCFELATAS
ncbi:hypothetical protein Cni_G24218 [Canna indica]|uniref:Reverse transcriptase domain-containing protein n=1 Tax=Canna indica TaxID=4628 RepID=A0AAQ3L216_9LILI|nr:hypothetical protein Cni_G24218 [Canna indica]